MAKAKGNRNDSRPSGKAAKKRPKVWDAEKRRLVTKQQYCPLAQWQSRELLTLRLLVRIQQGQLMVPFAPLQGMG